MVYVATTGAIIYLNPYQPFSINGYHHALFDEYNSFLSMKDKHNTGSLLLKQDPESLLCHSELINLIPCEHDLTYTPFHDTIIITYEIELFLDGNKIGLNLLDDKYFTIPHAIYMILNSPAGHQLET